MTEAQQLELLESIKSLMDKLEQVQECPNNMSNQDLAGIRHRLYAGPEFAGELGRVKKIVEDLS